MQIHRTRNLITLEIFNHVLIFFFCFNKMLMVIILFSRIKIYLSTYRTLKAQEINVNYVVILL